MSRTLYSGVIEQWGAKFLKGIRKESGNSFQAYDELMTCRDQKIGG